MKYNYFCILDYICEAVACNVAVISMW